LAIGFGVGVTAATLFPVLFLNAAKRARPAARHLAVAALGAYERGREAAAELGEHVEDLAAEVRADMVQAEMAEARTTAASESGQAADPETARTNGQSASRGGARGGSDHLTRFVQPEVVFHSH